MVTIATLVVLGTLLSGAAVGQATVAPTPLAVVTQPSVAGTAAADVDLVATVTVDPDPAAEGDTVTFTVTVTNRGELAARNVEIRNSPAALFGIGDDVAVRAVRPIAGAADCTVDEDRGILNPVGLYTQTFRANGDYFERDLVNNIHTLSLRGEKAPEVPSLVPGGTPAGDLDGDDLYEDTNGDGALNVIDVAVLLDAT